MNNFSRKLLRAVLNPRHAAAKILGRTAYRLLRGYPHFRQIDFVDFGSVGLFMFRNDNLYLHAVPSDRKDFAPGEFARRVQSGDVNGFASRALEEAAESRPAFILETILNVCFCHGVPVVLLDIGANTGLVGLKAARFAEHAGGIIDVILFEPGSSAELAEANIAANGFKGRVEFRADAVADYTGMAIIRTSPGYSDSDRLTLDDALGESIDRVVPTVELSSVIDEAHKPGTALFVKLDTEGLEPALLASSRKIRAKIPSIIFFEYMPWRYDADTNRKLLRDFAEDHTIFDLGYLPNPWFAREIPASEFPAFETEIREREFGYTDLIAIPSSFPCAEEIIRCLKRITAKEKPTYFLVD
jgi:FkbM family methyltransferase